MEDKKKFVEGVLQAVVKESDPDVMSLEYKADDYKETVLIRYKEDYSFKVNVTMNSKAAIVRDVMKII